MIKKGDFIELDYEGYTAEDNTLFDTTIEEVGKKANLNNKQKYEPTIICVGENHLLPGLDKFVEGKDLGKHEVSIAAEEAFGKRNAKLLQLIPMNKFKKQKIQPFAGLELNIDGNLGVVRSISGGRVIVDFNHPLSGKDLKYKLEIKRIVDKPQEQVEAILKLSYVPYEKVEITKEGDKDHAIIHVAMMPPEAYAEGINQTVKKLTKIELVSFQINKKE